MSDFLYSGAATVLYWLTFLRACVRFFFSATGYLFKNYEKCSLFHLESSFRYWDIQISVVFFVSFSYFSDLKGQIDME